MPPPKAKKLSSWRKWIVSYQTEMFPELVALDDLALRLEAIGAANRHTWPTVLVIFGLLHPIFILLTRDWFRAVDAKYYFLPFTLYMFSFGFVLLTVPYRIHRKKMQRTIRQKITELGFPMCIGCGYQLQGVVEPRCPECGKPYTAAEPVDSVGRAE